MKITSVQPIKKTLTEVQPNLEEEVETFSAVQKRLHDLVSEFEVSRDEARPRDEKAIAVVLQLHDKVMVVRRQREGLALEVRPGKGHPKPLAEGCRALGRSDDGWRYELADRPVYNGECPELLVAQGWRFE